jgi:transposase
MLLTEGQASDHRGAALMLPHLPPARELIADRGYDSRPFRDALQARGTVPCIPPTRSRKIPIPHDAMLCRQRHRIEIIFGRLKDWRRIAMRYDRCAHTFPRCGLDP